MKSSIRSSKGIRAIQVVGCYDLFSCAFEVKCRLQGRASPIQRPTLYWYLPPTHIFNSTHHLSFSIFYCLTSSPCPLYSPFFFPFQAPPASSPAFITRSRLQLNPGTFGAWECQYGQTGRIHIKSYHRSVLLHGGIERVVREIGPPCTCAHG